MTPADRIAPFVRSGASRRGAAQRLRRGASISALAALLSAAPAFAQANQACGVPVDGAATCVPDAANFPEGISYEVAAPAPQDLTIVIPAETVIAPTADDTAGVSVTSSGGAVTVSAAGTSIQTSGSRGIGLRAATAEGLVAIDAGTVYTSGYRADGIVADAGAAGDIRIDAQSVITVGEAATGVRANAGAGDITVHTGGVYAYGAGSDAIYAASTGGNVTIDTNYAYATGGSGRGIVAYSSGTTTVHAQAVVTSGGGIGTEADATGITAVGTAVAVDVDQVVRTDGDYAVAIMARSNHVYGDPSVVPAIRVSAAEVATNGAYSHGIVALNYAESGATSVAAGRVSTRGDVSFGIYAGGHGDVSVTADSVSTVGAGSEAIHAVSFGGDISVISGTVSTRGDSAGGIYAINYSQGAVSVTSGSVKTRRDNAIGIGALSIGDVRVDSGTVETSGYGSQGIVAYSVLGTVDVTSGSVVTTGGNATGIGGYSFGQGKSVHLTGTSVETRGDYAVGMLALAGHGAAIVNATGTISTTGVHSEGIAASGVGIDGNAAVIINAATVITSGGGARGVAAQGAFGDVSITVDHVVTSGGVGGGRHSTFAEGILAGVTEGNISIDAGTVETSGMGGVGIDSSVVFGTQTVDVDKVVTTGGHAPGVFTSAEEGKTIIHAGSVTTSGEVSHGILAQSFFRNPYIDADRSITITAGTVATSGEGSDGIYAFGAEGISIDAGAVTTAGRGSLGIYALSAYDNVAIKAGQVTTSGDYAPAVFALAPYGDVSVDAGSIRTSGAYSDGVRAGGNNASVTVNSIDVAGRGAKGVDMLAANGNAHLEVGSITGSGYGNIGAQVMNFGGDAVIKVDSVKLTGYGATGILAVAENGSIAVAAGSIEVGEAGAAISTGAYIGNASVTVGSIVSGGAGISATAGHGDVTVVSGSIATSGGFGKGIYTNANGGQSSITITGNLSTTGEKGFGIQATSVGGDNLIDNQKAISTTGSYAYGVIGNTLVGNVRIKGGTVSTSGDHASGIVATAVGPYSSATVVADRVTTTGANADGIFAQSPLDVSIPFLVPPTVAAVPSAPATGTPDHNVSVTSGTVRVTGAGSVGIRVRAAGNAQIDATNTSAANGNAIHADAYGTAAITVRGTTSSQGDAVWAKGENVTLTIASGGVVSGGHDAIVASAVGVHVPTPDQGGGDGGIGIGLLAADVPPMVTIANGGTIQGGSGYAVRVAAGTVQLANSGTLAGKVWFGSGDDLLTNSGTFAAAGDSDFGEGNDRFVNSGTLRILPGSTAAGTVSFLGLERFDNTGGTIDLRNGHAGDSFVLSGNYVGSNGHLALDIGGGTSDRFTVTGMASGTTRITLADVGNANAVLTGNAPIALVQVGAGSAAGAFTLASTDFGFVHYGLRYDAVSGRFMLASAAGAPVYRHAKLNEAAANIWNQKSDALSTHFATLRDAEDAPASQLWGSFGGGTDRIRQTRAGSDIGYRQNGVGGRLGYDFGGSPSGRPAFGVTGGYDSTKLVFSSASARVAIDSLDIGGYARFRTGALFVNGLASVAFHSLKATDRGLGYSDDFSGHSVGAQLEAGGRFAVSRFFMEPSAKLAWSRTSLGDLEALSQNVAFDNATSLRGTFGARFGGSVSIGDQGRATFYGGLDYVHEFAGTAGAILFSGGASEAIANDPLNDRVRSTIGVNIATAKTVSGFVEGSVTTGSGRSGGSGKAGIRIGF